jgi:Tol biopolymer transport system component
MARLQVARLDGEGFGAPVDLGEPVNVGGAAHGFVAPDESYILFNSPRAGSYTRNDIWVTFRSQDGSWTPPVNLGKRINRDANAVLCPTVSPDGRYLFFTRLQEGGTGYVYWVSARIVDEIRRQGRP